jgi:hypothetical protein
MEGLDEVKDEFKGSITEEVQEVHWLTHGHARFSWQVAGN